MRGGADSSREKTDEAVPRENLSLSSVSCLLPAKGVQQNLPEGSKQNAHFCFLFLPSSIQDELLEGVSLIFLSSAFQIDAGRGRGRYVCEVYSNKRMRQTDEIHAKRCAGVCVVVWGGDTDRLHLGSPSTPTPRQRHKGRRQEGREERERRCQTLIQVQCLVHAKMMSHAKNVSRATMSCYTCSVKSQNLRVQPESPPHHIGWWGRQCKRV